MKKMNYLLFALSLSLLAFNLPAQSLDRFVIGSAGLSSQNENIQLSFTVGEPVVSSFHTDKVQLNQGFQQTQVEEIPTGIQLPAYVQGIKAYPNPVGNVLYLDVNAAKVFKFSVEVYDLNGRRKALPAHLLSSTGHSQHQIDLMSFVPGIYLLMIITKEGYPVKTFKIQKY